MPKRYLLRLTIATTIAAVITAPIVFWLLTAFGLDGTIRVAIVAAITASVSSVAGSSALPQRRVPAKA